MKNPNKLSIRNIKLQKTEADLPTNFYTEDKVTEMLNSINCDLEADYQEVYFPNHTNNPFTNMLVALLERTILDLFVPDTVPDSYINKKAAICWLLSSDTASVDGGFTFYEVAHHLDISQQTVALFKAMARSIQYKKGEYYEVYSRSRSRGNGRLHSNN